MREITQNINVAKKRVELLKGMEILLVVNKGRNKIVKFAGTIDNTYESIFTVSPSSGEDPLQTYSYSDVLTKNIKFFPLNTKN